MFTRLLTVTLGALSFITDGAVPSWDNHLQHPQAIPGLHATQAGSSVSPTPGTYRIVTPDYGYAEIRTYRIGEALYVSRTLEYSGPFGSFELMPMDDTGNVFGLRNVGQGASIVIDGDNKFVTTTDDYKPQGFTMERTETEGFFIIRTTDGTDRVWTLNPDEGPVMQRIMLAPACGSGRNSAQRFKFVSLNAEEAPRVVGHSAKFAHVNESSSPISPGRYIIHETLLRGVLRTLAVGQELYTSNSTIAPGDYGVWSVAGDDKSGYNITNVGLNLPLSVTQSKTLSANYGVEAAKFTFVKRGYSGRVGVELMNGDGVWQLDTSRGPIYTPVLITNKMPGFIRQEFEFVAVAQ
ncbi:unnamed protein product [Mycena citricolor]|uniref:Uncharacterized protein n=1 Tax=Mycena citricolor TaxID=2018698 RepID=A0AAD2K807_9AGAR|nr:unnamed protein product [Mycena citricolor]